MIISFMSLHNPSPQFCKLACSLSGGHVGIINLLESSYTCRFGDCTAGSRIPAQGFLPELGALWFIVFEGEDCQSGFYHFSGGRLLNSLCWCQMKLQDRFRNIDTVKRPNYSQ